MNPGTASVVNTIAQRLGNTTAKIRFPANDTFSVETAGAERLRIGVNGGVGIGTDYLSGNASVYHKLMVEGDTTSPIAVAKIVRKNSSASNSRYTFEVDSSVHTSNMTSGGAMSVDVNSGRAFTIDGNGQIGIGTISPQKKLHVHVSSAGPAFLVTGNIPGVILNSSAANSSDNDRSHFGQATGSNNFCNGASPGDTVLRGTNSGKLIFGLGTSIKMLITNDGNMGLGDTAPPNFTGYRSLSIHGSTGGALVFGDDGTDEWEVNGGDGVFKYMIEQLQQQDYI